MKTKRIFVYGNLWQGFYNYDKFLKGKITNGILEAYTLGGLFYLPNKGYPAVISGTDTIVDEVFDVIDDRKILENIHQMEGLYLLKNPIMSII